MAQHHTKQMDEYMEDVLATTFKVYKDVAPEIVSRALGISIEEVKIMSVTDFKKKMYNLEVEYRTVDNADEKEINYKDSKKIGTILEKYAGVKMDKQDKLTIHLNEKGVEEKESVEDIKKMRYDDGMSKFLSDIDYVAHEIAHGLENKISVDNPSLADERIDLMSSGEKIDFDLGETFAVSMERVVLDKLSEEGALDKYGISEYVRPDDIEDVWNKKRAKMRADIIGTTTNGKDMSRLDIHLVPYDIIKKQGIDEIIDFMERGNLLKISRDVPEIGDKQGITDFLDKVEKGDYAKYLIGKDEKYIPENSDEEISEFINKMNSIKGQEKSKEEDDLTRYNT